MATQILKAMKVAGKNQLVLSSIKDITSEILYSVDGWILWLPGSSPRDSEN